MSLLAIEKLYFSAGNGMPQLENIKLDINKEEIVFIAGKSGEGKTTLLKIIYGMLKFPQGSLTFNGSSIDQNSSKQIRAVRRNLGFLSKEEILLPDRSVSENLVYFLQLYGCSGKELHNQQAALLFKFGLSEHQKKYVSELSYFDKMKLSLAIAVAGKPLLLLVDEPTVNLDPEHAQAMIDLILMINKAGTAILWATHNYEVLKKASGRVYLLDSKQIKEIPTKRN